MIIRSTRPRLLRFHMRSDKYNLDYQIIATKTAELRLPAKYFVQRRKRNSPENVRNCDCAC